MLKFKILIIIALIINIILFLALLGYFIYLKVTNNDIIVYSYLVISIVTLITILIFIFILMLKQQTARVYIIINLIISIGIFAAMVIICVFVFRRLNVVHGIIFILFIIVEIGIIVFCILSLFSKESISSNSPIKDGVKVCISSESNDPYVKTDVVPLNTK